MSSPRETFAGRAGVLLTALGLFAIPLWVMISAGIIQVFPDLVGYDPTSVVLVMDSGGTMEIVDAKPTMWNWFQASVLAAAAVVALMGSLLVLGGFTRLGGLVQRFQQGRERRRFAEIAGDVVLTGVELKTTTEAAAAPAGSASTAPPQQAAHEEG